MINFENITPENLVSNTFHVALIDQKSLKICQIYKNGKLLQFSFLLEKFVQCLYINRLGCKKMIISRDGNDFQLYDRWQYKILHISFDCQLFSRLTFHLFIQRTFIRFENFNNSRVKRNGSKKFLDSPRLQGSRCGLCLRKQEEQGVGMFYKLIRFLSPTFFRSLAKNYVAMKMREKLVRSGGCRIRGTI